MTFNLFCCSTTHLCCFWFRRSYLLVATELYSDFHFLPAAHSLQTIFSCVITGSLAEFRTCLSVGLQRSPSPACNIDVPFGRRFHPKLLTGPLCTFSAQPVPAGVKPPHAGSVNVILHHEGHKKNSLLSLTSSLSSRHPLNLLSGNLAHQNTTTQLSQATTNPGKESGAEKCERKREGKGGVGTANKD